jgi:hypothetical protein
MAANFKLEAIKLSIAPEKRQLIIDWQNGQQAAFPYIWPRHAQFMPVR